MSKSKIILLDQDGPIDNFYLGFCNVWNERYPDTQFDPTYQKDYFLWETFPQYKDEIVALIREKNFFMNLPFNYKCLTAINYLLDRGHNVFICTENFWGSQYCRQEKENRIVKYLGKRFERKIIQTNDKTLVSADILIDDKEEILGVRKPDWMRIVFDATYNQKVVGPRICDWYNWQELFYQLEI